MMLWARTNDFSDLRYESEEVRKLEKEKRRWLWAMLKAYDQIECKLAGVDDSNFV